MVAVVRADVLSADWLPPVALGRTKEIEALVRLLERRTEDTRSRVVFLAAPRGAGSSTVARIAARVAADLDAHHRGGGRPRILTVRTRYYRGPRGVAAALLRHYDDALDGRGFPTAELLAGFFRRSRRANVPVIVVLDDVAVGGPELEGIVRAFRHPDRFLPEGEDGLPPIDCVVVGTWEGLRSTVKSEFLRAVDHTAVSIPPYSPAEIRRILADRFARAVGSPAPPAVLDRLVARTELDGGGASRAVERLRQELIGVPAADRLDASYERREALRVALEPHLWEAIHDLAPRRSVGVRDLREAERTRAQATGAPRLATTTFWRRLVQLERAGYLAREVRFGGGGGTRSQIRFLRPVPESVRVRGPETPRGFGPACERWGSDRTLPVTVEPPYRSPGTASLPSRWTIDPTGEAPSRQGSVT